MKRTFRDLYIEDYCNRNNIQSYSICEDGSVDLVTKKHFVQINNKPQQHYYLRRHIGNPVDKFVINNIDTEILFYANLKSTHLHNLARSFTGNMLILSNFCMLYDITNLPRFTNDEVYKRTIEIEHCAILDNFNGIQKDFCGDLKFSTTSIKDLLTLPYSTYRIALRDCHRFEDFTDIEHFSNLEELHIYYREYYTDKKFKNILNIFENKTLRFFTVDTNKGLSYSNCVLKIAQDFINTHLSRKLDYVMDFVILAHDHGFEIT